MFHWAAAKYYEDFVAKIVCFTVTPFPLKFKIYISVSEQKLKVSFAWHLKISRCHNHSFFLLRSCRKTAPSLKDMPVFLFCFFNRMIKARLLLNKTLTSMIGFYSAAMFHCDSFYL